jgi:tetratricopeptide (TPR) repeat protein
MAIRQVDYAAARLFHEQSLTIYRELEDERSIAASLWALGSLSMNEADHTSACALFEESLAIHRRLGNRQGMFEVLKDLGHETWHQGNYVSARRFLEEAVVLGRECGKGRPDVFTLWSLGLVAFDQHNYEEAHSLYEEGLTAVKELGGVWLGIFLVEAFAALIAAEGRYVPAARLLGATETYRQNQGIPLPFAHRSDYDRPVATIRAGLNEQAFTAAWAEGGAMTLEQAIEYALAGETG